MKITIVNNHIKNLIGSMVTCDVYTNDKIFFCGIGGIGMSSLAITLRKFGFSSICGSDISHGYTIDNLLENKISVNKDHRPENIFNAKVIVYSSAIDFEYNPEIVEARRQNIPIFHRNDLLQAIIKLYSIKIVVCGSHGKTTTTSMIGYMLYQLGLKPTIIVGGMIKNFQSNSVVCNDDDGKVCYDIVVVESDESDGSFVNLDCEYSIFTSLSPEHLNYYGTFDNLIATKKMFYQNKVSKSSFYNINDQNINQFMIPFGDNIEFYGSRSSIFSNRNENKNNSVCYQEYQFDKEKMSFIVNYQGNDHSVEMNIFGEHNVINATGSIALINQLILDAGNGKIENLNQELINHIERINFNEICKSISGFYGSRRRIDKIGTISNSIVYDDYGHHPREILTTLNALRSAYINENIKFLAIFEPHRYSRIFNLFNEFAQTLSIVDKLLITPIYAASEENIYGVSAFDLASKISSINNKELNKDIFVLNNYEEILPITRKIISEKTLEEQYIIVDFGAGKISMFMRGIVNSD
jgi:UDP-N-acetylmuramate--alanine ligase